MCCFRETAHCSLRGVTFPCFPTASLHSGHDFLVPVDRLVSARIPAATCFRIHSEPALCAVPSGLRLPGFRASAPALAASGHAWAAPLSPAVVVPANSSVLITLPGAASMSAASQSACQGSVFRLSVTMAVRK